MRAARRVHLGTLVEVSPNQLFSARARFHFVELAFASPVAASEIKVGLAPLRSSSLTDSNYGATRPTPKGRHKEKRKM